MKHYVYKLALRRGLTRSRLYRKFELEFTGALDARYLMITEGEQVPPPEIILENHDGRWGEKSREAFLSIIRQLDRSAHADRSRNQAG